MAHGLSTRPTQDVDLFTSPGSGDAAEARDQFVTAVRERGWTVEETQGSQTFRRLLAHACCARDR